MNIIEKISELDSVKRQKLIERIKNDGQTYGIFPLTESQEIFWKKYRLGQPLLLIGNIRFILKLTPINEEKAKWLINELRSLHDVCRYRFVEIDGEVFQYIDNDTKPNIAVYTSDAADREKVHECYQDFFEKNFELDSDFPIVFGIVKANDDSCRIMIKMHHIVADGFSVGVIIRDIYSILNGTVTKCKVQFQDYVADINEKIAADTEYWIEKIRTADKRLDPPLDYPRFSEEKDNSEKAFVEYIKGNDFLKLRDFDKSIKRNFFNVSASLFSMILQRWANKGNMIMASTFFNREREEAADIIGNFSSFLPLVYRYNGDMTLNDYIKENIEVFKEAMTHGNVVNMSLQKAYPYECCSEYMPMYQTIFAYHSKTIYSSVIGNADEINIELDDYNFNTLLKHLCVDIIIRIEELEDMYSIAIGYNRKFFDEQSIKQIAGIFKSMLIDLSRLIETRLDDITLVDYSDIPLYKRISSPAPSAYKEADIDISKGYIIIDSEGISTCILDSRMQPVPVNFCGNIFVQKNDRWYSTGKAGRITFDGKLIIDDESSALRFINGVECDLHIANEKLKNAFDGIRICFIVSDEGALILTYCGIKEQITPRDVAQITGIEPIYVHKSERLNQNSFKKYIGKISNIVDTLRKKYYTVTVCQHYGCEEVTICFSSDSRPDDSFIEQLRSSYPDDRIEFCFCSSMGEKYVYPSYVLTDTQKHIRNVWKDIIGNSDFGIYDNFYETGNINVGELVFKIREMTEKDMSIMTLFEYPDIFCMSNYIDEGANI